MTSSNLKVIHSRQAFSGAMSRTTKVKQSKVTRIWQFADRSRHTATGTHVPYGITQRYLPPGRGDIPAFTPAEAGTRFSDPGGMQG